MGPVEFIVLAFPEEQLRVRAVDSLVGVRRSRSVRIVDALVVTKTAGGEVLAAELDEFEELSGVLVGDGVERLIGPEDVQEAAELLDRGSCAIVALIEHLWAEEAAKGVRAAGGHVAGSVRLPPERLDEVRAALAERTAAGREKG
ncbi:DUF6325 family protein [Streptomyces sp. CBMA152]|uniref:DUF6325 family protein n=1 Tax=Streptomyces sp. CBMA152 TaxID=1896312 RepID=UPI0016616531|nr:DUF6325 family protein [Streptomyces sp. CBMA152]MBD0746944.1 hypothetical protein [Streptomyces sp. CBMA152]MBD0747647.1 hypothetical protein [Streptomyces sp. CBMA152]